MEGLDLAGGQDFEMKFGIVRAKKKFLSQKFAIYLGILGRKLFELLHEIIR
jgi:hypothetical protein